MNIINTKVAKLIENISHFYGLRDQTIIKKNNIATTNLHKKRYMAKKQSSLSLDTN